MFLICIRGGVLVVQAEFVYHSRILRSWWLSSTVTRSKADALLAGVPILALSMIEIEQNLWLMDHHRNNKAPPALLLPYLTLSFLTDGRDTTYSWESSSNPMKDFLWSDYQLCHFARLAYNLHANIIHFRINFFYEFKSTFLKLVVQLRFDGFFKEDFF